MPVQPTKALIVELIAQLGGTVAIYDRHADTVAVQGDYAYLGVGPRLVVLDVSNPSQTVVVGQTEVWSGLVYGVAVAGDQAYVVDRHELYVVDVSNPAHPSVVASYPIEALHVVVAGDYAYLGGADGMHIMDVADPAHLHEVGFFSGRGYVVDLAVDGNRAYVASRGNLHMVDVTNPSAPLEIGRYQSSRDLGIYGVAAAGNSVYAGTEYGLEIVDVSDPAAPYELSYSLTGVWISGMAVTGDHLYVTSAAGLHILDVSDPAHPGITLYKMPGEGGSVVTAKAGSGSVYAYVTERGGLRIVDVTDPTAPREVGFYVTLGEVLDVVAASNLVSVATGAAGMAAIDVSDPARPQWVGSYATSRFVRGLARVGDVVGLAEADYEEDVGGLRLINVADPATPVETGYYGEVGRAEDVAMVGRPGQALAYLASLGGECKVVDISDPASPRAVGTIYSYVSPRSVTTFGDPMVAQPAYVLIGIGEWGLVIVDVSNPSMPVNVGHLRSQLHQSRYTEEAAIAGRYAYIADGGGLVIADISDPTQPRELSFYDTFGHAGSVAPVPDSTARPNTWEPNYVLVAAGDLHVVDVSDPSAPKSDGVLAVPVGSDKITVAGNVAYAAGGDNGLLVLRLLQDKVSGIVETTGGSVASSSGNITIVFPAGAFTQPAVVTYRHLWSDQDTGDLVGIDRTFTVDAVDPAVGQPAQLAPGQTLTISVRYSDADRGPTIEETLALYAWDGQQWEREPTSVVDTTADTVTAAPTRLAHLWAVLGRTERLFLPYLEIAEP